MATTPSDVGITAGAGTLINTVDITNGGNTDKRQVMCVGGPDLADLTNIAAVVSSAPSSSVLGVVVRPVDMELTQAVSLTTNGTTQALTVLGRTAFGLELTSLGTGGTVVFEGLISSTWIAFDMWRETTESYITGNISVADSYWAEAVGPVTQVRVRVTGITSGTITGTIIAGYQPVGHAEYVADVNGTMSPVIAIVGGSDGTNARALSVDSSGNVSIKRKPDATSTFAPTNVDSTALEASHILKASAGVLYGFTGYSARTTSQFIQVHNTTTLPADTAVPIVVIFIPPGPVSFSWDAPAELGKFFSTGITICNSTTGPTKTIGSADCWFNASIS